MYGNNGFIIFDWMAIDKNRSISYYFITYDRPVAMAGGSDDPSIFYTPLIMGGVKYDYVLLKNVFVIIS